MRPIATAGAVWSLSLSLSLSVCVCVGQDRTDVFEHPPPARLASRRPIWSDISTPAECNPAGARLALDASRPTSASEKTTPPTTPSACPRQPVAAEMVAIDHTAAPQTDSPHSPGGVSLQPSELCVIIIMSDHIGRRDASREGGCSKTSVRS